MVRLCIVQQLAIVDERSRLLHRAAEMEPLPPAPSLNRMPRHFALAQPRPSKTKGLILCI
jgi:hypothetical protein